MSTNARINMIKQQLRTGDVLNEQLLDLYDLIPREDFVPELFRQFAYSDMQIPLTHDQRMLTPLEECKILQGLELHGNETILEIGTG
ncbi:MAG: protein-L-isoaspartate O-methyltransferase family protein, partial [Legionella sp.]